MTMDRLCWSNSESATKSKKLILRLISFIFMALIPCIGGCSDMPHDSINNMSFSHDGQKVVFDRCNEGCQIQVYDLRTGELAAYQSPSKESWTMGRYSYDGKRIAFSVIPIKFGGELDLDKMQIAVMDADGKNYRKVTIGPGAKLYPVFSHSGRKLLYACAARIRKSGMTPAADYDAWEVDLETGVQTRLTFFEYFYMSNLAYFPDDKRFIYFGERPSVIEGVSPADRTAFEKKISEYKSKQFYLHGVVVMEGEKLVPRMYNFGEKFFVEKPLLSKDGNLLICAKNGNVFYLFSPDGNHRYIGSGGSVDSAAISPEGDLLGMIVVKETLDIFSVRDGKRMMILYLARAEKITNWENVRQQRESLYGEKFTMIPDKPSRFLNR